MKELTEATLEDFVQTNRYAVVHFWASWNGYDVRVKNILTSEIPEQVSKVVAVGRLDTEPVEHHDLCKRYEIRNLPFLAFYRDGSLIETVTGIGEPAEIIGHLQRLIA